MSGIQHGRAKGRKTFKKPKSFLKAEKMYKEVFNDRKVAAAHDAAFRPMYSRVTKKLITKKNG